MAKCDRCSRLFDRRPDWLSVWADGCPTDAFVCPGCQTPEEYADAEAADAMLDYENVWLDASDWQIARPEGDWTHVDVTRSCDESGKVLMHVDLPPPVLRVEIKPHADPRLHRLFNVDIAPTVLAALERCHCRPRSPHSVDFDVSSEWGPDDAVLVVEDPGEDAGMLVCTNTEVSPYLLGVFAPPTAAHIRQAIDTGLRWEADEVRAPAGTG